MDSAEGLETMTKDSLRRIEYEKEIERLFSSRKLSDRQKTGNIY
jgi:hypothetical protein